MWCDVRKTICGGFQVMRYGSWKGNGVNSVAPTTNLYSQYSYGANWKKLW